MQMLTNEYRLLRQIGRGGMGEVWEAARIKDNDVVVPCAIKLLHADITESARERKLFFDEARIATQLDHSRIVKVIDVGASRTGQPFLVMERVDGIDLRAFLKEAESQNLTPLDIDLVTYIVGEVLAALDYAHERTVAGADAGIVHSDITPGNILISSSGEVKLTDFGIARFAATAGPMSRAIGTPRYMSPEQIMGNPRRETDIYGLGVVLHEMLDGARFLDGLTPDDFRQRVMSGPPPELERRQLAGSPAIPAWLDQLRRRMIATDLRDRPRASEARAVLIEHCPRYLAAGEQLKTKYYARLIGRRRSGVTQLLARVDDAHAAALLSQIGRDAVDAKRPDPSAAVPAGVAASAQPIVQPGSSTAPTSTASRAGQLHLGDRAAASNDRQAADADAEHDVEVTELLPLSTGVSELSLSTPAPDRSTRILGGLAIASGMAALAMLITAGVLWLKFEREAPATDTHASVAQRPQAPELEPPGATDSTEPTEPIASQATIEPRSSVASPPAIDPIPPAQVEPPKVEPPPVEPPPVEPPKLEPAQAAKPAPTPPKPKLKSVGVVFLIETKLTGKLKLGSKIADVKNRAAYLELQPGVYTIRWQPTGATDWETFGKVTIGNTWPRKQQVRISDGKITQETL